jgi:hypothetical protein
LIHVTAAKISLRNRILALTGLRDRSSAVEAALVEALNSYLTEGDTTALAFSGRIGVAPAYLSDVRNKRRNVSDELLRKLHAVVAEGNL